MKKTCLTIAAAALVAGVSAASAADLPMRMKAMPMAAPAMVFSWTGFYVGGHVGGAWASADVTDVDGYAGGAPAGTVTSLDKTGVFGGGTVGFNYQMGAFVLGLEGDFGYMGLRSETALAGSLSGTTVGINDGWYGDITGRLGFAVDRTLFYVKGGWAWYNDIARFNTATGSFSSRTGSGVSDGATVGAGVEYAFAPNWSVKGEYQYFNFQHADYTVFNATLTPFRFNEKMDIHTGKIGVNYRF